VSTNVDPKDLLLEAGLALSSELSLDAVLNRIVTLAIQLTGARYGALGVVGPAGRLIEFVTSGISDEDRGRIGEPPHGGGILGVLILDARPLRLPSIADDPRSVGFPPNHPPMKSFLGAPVKALGEVFGNIYLTEKQGASEFDVADQETLVVLATQAGVAVANARLFERAERRGRWLEAVREVTNAILDGTGSSEVLALVTARARDLAGAATAGLVVPSDDGELTMLVADGSHAEDLLGMAVPREKSISGDVIRSGRPRVLEDVSGEPGAHEPMVRLGKLGPAIFLPVTMRGEAAGTLMVANPRGSEPFAEEVSDLVQSFAIQASSALEYSRARADRDRLALMEDRERIAKELHDGVIQSLFAVGMGLQGTALLAGDEDLSRRIEGAVEELDSVIRDLRSYIFGLRPGILVDRALDQALRDLAEDFERRTGVVTVTDVDEIAASSLSPVGADLVQLAREALSNVGRHAGATTVRMSLATRSGGAVFVVDDDGKGFDPAEAAGRGSGLSNMRERAEALGATLTLDSVAGEGTTLTVILPG
jgi:signal transduction histidine kinase